VEEVLYSAMEDFQLDIVIGEGPAARSVRIDLPPFTLIGATTRSGLLSTPLRDRFGIPMHLNFYDTDDLEKIVQRNARLLNLDITQEGAHEIAKRSRGTPRITGRLLRRVRDFAGKKTVDASLADLALNRLEVDKSGLDSMDRRYLCCIAEKYAGGPVGADTLSAALSEERDTLEEVIEPYLMQLGLVMRTPRGRVLSPAGYKHLGLKTPLNMIQPDLLDSME
jgi:Holliday junction DNA helicase RuvB